LGKDVSVLLLVFSQEYPPSNKEEVCEIKRVKEEVYETEITVEEHSVSLDSSDDPQRLVHICNSSVSLQYLDLMIRNIFEVNCLLEYNLCSLLFCSGGPKFKSQSGGGCPDLGFVFHSVCRKMPDQYLKLRYDHVIPCLPQIIL
jgi:hypothetical protein